MKFTKLVNQPIDRPKPKVDEMLQEVELHGNGSHEWVC